MNKSFKVSTPIKLFSGRASRKDYWSFVLVIILLDLLVAVIEGALTGSGILPDGGGAPILGTIFRWVVFVPALNITVKRLHDIGRSGWWVLVTFVPVVGSLALLFFMLQKSQPGTNQYGPGPGQEQPIYEDSIRRTSANDMTSDTQ